MGKAQETSAPADNAVADALAKFVGMVEDGPIRQISITKAKYRTPWHPSGDRDRPKLKRKIRMQGVQLRERMLSNEEIDLLNQLPPGRYQNRRWFVQATDGEDDGTKIDIYLPNKTAADRLTLAQQAPTLVAALKLMIDEAKSQSSRKQARAAVE